MLTTMKYVLSTLYCGIIVNPTGTWNRKEKFLYGPSQVDATYYATNPDYRKSLSSTQVFLHNSPIMTKCSTQKVITLSVMEAEL